MVKFLVDFMIMQFRNNRKIKKKILIKKMKNYLLNTLFNLILIKKIKQA